MVNIAKHIYKNKIKSTISGMNVIKCDCHINKQQIEE